MLFGFSPWLFLAAIAGVMLLLCLLGILIGLLTPGGRSKDANGVARQRRQSKNWASWKQVRDDLGDDDEPSPRRLALCRLDGHQLANPPLRSLCVIAPSGAGKTPSVVVPALLRHHGPAVVTSIKSDVYELTHHHRARLGRVWLFDPSNVVGESVRWSPLAHIRTWADALDAARWIQESSQADSASSGVDDMNFWNSQARALLAPLLVWAAAKHHTIRDIGRVIGGGDETERFITAELDSLGEVFEDAVTYWRRFTNLAARTKSSVVSTAATILEAWNHPRITETINVRADDPDAFDPTTLLGTNDTLYIVSPASEQQLFGPVFETLINAITMCVERAYGERGGIAIDPPLLLALDEAANIAPLKRLDYLASAGAGQGILLMSVFQDDGQVRRIYGLERARTILSNHYATLYMGGISDPETLQRLSTQIGTDQIRQVSSSKSSTGGSSTISYHEMPVAPAAWLRQLPPGEVVAIAGRFPPILGQVTGWFEDKAMRALIPTEITDRFDRAHARPQTLRKHTKKPRKVSDSASTRVAMDLQPQTKAGAPDRRNQAWFARMRQEMRRPHE